MHVFILFNLFEEQNSVQLTKVGIDVSIVMQFVYFLLAIFF